MAHVVVVAAPVNGARWIGGECVVVCVWSLIWGAVAVILHGSRRRRRQSVVRDRFGGECVVVCVWSLIWGGSVVRTRSGEWVTDLGEKKKPYVERKQNKTLVSRASLSSHTG